jgi:hypothetical protein
LLPDKNDKITMKELFYIAPEVEIHGIQAEGVLCASNEMLDEYEGEW